MLSGVRTKHTGVKITLGKISWKLDTRSSHAFPLACTILDKLLALCWDVLRGLLNQVLMLLAYDLIYIRSKLVSLRLDEME